MALSALTSVIGKTFTRANGIWQINSASTPRLILLTAISRKDYSTLLSNSTGSVVIWKMFYIPEELWLETQAQGA